MKWSAHNGCTSVAVGQKNTKLYDILPLRFSNSLFLQVRKVLQQKYETDQYTYSENLKEKGRDKNKSGVAKKATQAFQYYQTNISN